MKWRNHLSGIPPVDIALVAATMIVLAAALYSWISDDPHESPSTSPLIASVPVLTGTTASCPPGFPYMLAVNPTGAREALRCTDHLVDPEWK